jgi:hypothetical protein
MTKPGQIKYNFAELDRDREFQSFLNKSLEGKGEGVDMKKFKKGIESYPERFMIKK